MSLISGKNLISPFTNKIHLVTIIIVSLAFGLFRLSGGGVFQQKKASPFGTAPVVNTQTRSLLSTMNADETMAPPASQAAERTVQNQKSASADTRRDVGLDSLKDRNQAQKKSASPAGLDEIERSLGLR